jgi:eukaryotic-like serine/threonine-protein kinase
MPDASPHVKSIFGRALDMQSPAQRASYLDEACQGNAALRAEVEGLIGAVARAGDFLASPAVAEEVGASIGPYKLLEQIGEGGMGLVYMAEQQQPVRRLVALKIVKPGMDSRQVIARFEAERQALAMMEHASIAKVLDAGTTASGRPYFAMELVKGVPITKYCDQRHLTIKQRLELFIPACQAIQHAHQKGIIHRDLKPTNVLVAEYDNQPVPKIIDFGVAKATAQKLTEKTMFTGFGQLIGTLEYMSPEQAKLNQLDIDTRSDIYSLGVLLYELLTGTTPFDHAHLCTVAFDETLRIIREVEPPRPSTKIGSSQTLATIAANRSAEPARLGRQLSGDLDWIVMKCLEKDRNRRYETANGLAMDLRRYLANEPIVARPPSKAYRLWKFAQRNRGPVLSALLVLLALVGGMIGTTWNMMRATKAEAAAVNEARQKEAALRASQQSERESKDQLWLSLYERARAGRYSRQPGQRLDSLAALAAAAHIRPDAALRDEAIAAMALPDVKRAAAWQSSPPGSAAVAYGGQYRFYARADASGGISIRSIPDDQEIRRIVSGAILGKYLHFSPDDRFLLGLVEGYALRVWRVGDGQPALHEELDGCRSHAFSPDGRLLAIGQRERVLCFDLATGQEVRRFRLPGPAHTLAFHPDGSKLAIGYFNSNVVSVYDAASGAPVADLAVGAISDQVVAWHPDGERLAVTGSDPRIQIWNVAAKRKVATLDGHTQYVAVLTFHPDGELLASHGWDGQLLLWHPSTGRQLMRLTSVSAPQFSANGRWLGVAWHGERADCLEVTAAGEYRTLVSSAGAGRGGYGSGAISPDGRLLAVGMDEGARLWDLHSGRELAALPPRTTSVFFEGNADPKVSSGGPACSLLTCGSGGLLRWPLTSDDLEHGHLTIGPPQQISALPHAKFARRSDGRALAAVTDEGRNNKILDLETATVRQELGSHPLGGVQALSGDGRWAASCGWHSDRVRLWNAATGQMVHEWVLGKQTWVDFTPDSRALVVARGDEFVFWDLQTLQPIRRLSRDITQFPGHVAFSSGGRLMALEMAPAVIHLKEAATGRTVAKLEDPYGDRATWQDFTPDGTQLVVVSKFASAIHIWDLRIIRARLKEMNLDWDWPEFPQAAIRDSIAAPVTIEAVRRDEPTPARLDVSER